jgi:predicted DNA-binding transcriptional regulator YafY
MRTFVLTRMSEPVPTGKTFTPRPDFKADNYLKGSFSVFRGRDDYEVAIDFDAWATDLVRAGKWHASQQLRELPNGHSRLTLRLDNIEKIERWILSWGVHARVIAPRALATRIRTIARQMVKRYGEA